MPVLPSFKHATTAHLTKPLVSCKSWIRSSTRIFARPNSYYMPAESAKHQCTLMAFPNLLSANDDVEYLKAMRTEVASIANTIAKFEPVYLYSAEDGIADAQSMVDSEVTIKTGTVSELWMRDTGPTFVKSQADNKFAAIDLNFSYWGGKLPLAGDEDLARQVSRDFQVLRVPSLVRTEGGAIEVDGDGTFMGTESSIINDNRNPGKSKAEVEETLRALLGVEKFIWIPGLRDFDMTDDHVDALARFVKPGVVVVSEPAIESTAARRANFEEAMQILSTSTDARGRKLQLHTCKEPSLDHFPNSEEENLCASYVNYLLVNGGVILSKFGDNKADDAALQLFQQLFPDRKCVQVLVNTLPRTGGGIHCATQQVPTFEE